MCTMSSSQATVTDEEVLRASFDWSIGRGSGGVVDRLVQRGARVRTAVGAVERARTRGLVDWTSSRNHAWPTDRGMLMLGTG
jgi:hypothetical protein